MRARVGVLLAEILGTDAGGDRVTSAPERLCRHVVSVLGVTGAGVALMSSEGRHAGLVAASDGPAEIIEELQFSLGEGPCVDASRQGRPVLQSNLAVTGLSRWPVFGPAVTSHGVRALFAFPLQVGGIRVGVLDLYRNVPGSLSDLGLSEALAFSDVTTLVLLHMQDAIGRDGAASTLTAAYDNRAVIHQATGMVSVQLGVGLAEALLRLRGYAYAEQRPVAVVSAEVVGRRIRFDHTTAGASEGGP